MAQDSHRLHNHVRLKPIQYQPNRRPRLLHPMWLCIMGMLPTLLLYRVSTMVPSVAWYNPTSAWCVVLHKEQGSTMHGQSVLEDNGQLSIKRVQVMGNQLLSVMKIFHHKIFLMSMITIQRVVNPLLFLAKTWAIYCGK